MEQLVQTITNVIKQAQIPAVISMAAVILIAGYFFIWGGERGRSTAKGWLIGGGVGLILVLGAILWADTVKAAVAF